MTGTKSASNMKCPAPSRFTRAIGRGTISSETSSSSNSRMFFRANLTGFSSRPVFSSCNGRTSELYLAPFTGESVSATFSPSALRRGIPRITVAESRTGEIESAMFRGGGKASDSGMLNGNPSGNTPRACTSAKVPLRKASLFKAHPIRPYGANHNEVVAK